jgi:hypothetical protein
VEKETGIWFRSQQKVIAVDAGNKNSELFMTRRIAKQMQITVESVFAGARRHIQQGT